MTRNLPKKQSGFIILLGMLMLVLGAATWFGAYSQIKAKTAEIQANDWHVKHLHRIKERMLAYAVLHPELYSSAQHIPGVGYFPCPDENNDGQADSICGDDEADIDQLFVFGRVPYQISTRNYNFLDGHYDEANGQGVNNDLYWFAYDARFVNNSETFDGRYSELTTRLSDRVLDLSGNESAPLTLDNKEGVVMVLIYAGPPLAGQDRSQSAASHFIEQNTDSVVSGYTHNFRSSGDSADTYNDYVISITRREWEKAIMSRLSLDLDDDGRPDVCVENPNWIQQCTYTGASIPPYPCYEGPEDNLTGQGWGEILANCS